MESVPRLVQLAPTPPQRRHASLVEMATIGMEPVASNCVPLVSLSILTTISANVQVAQTGLAQVVSTAPMAESTTPSTNFVNVPQQ